MANRVEACELVKSSLGEFRTGLANRDLEIVYDEGDRRPRTGENGKEDGYRLVHESLVKEGLSGQALFFGAQTRKHPIGLPVHTPEMVRHSIGVYFPTAKDKREVGDAGEVQRRVDGTVEKLVRGSREKKVWLPFEDSLLVVTQGIIGTWQSLGVFPPVGIDHSTNATGEDDVWYGERNAEFLVRYVRAMIEAVGDLSVPGVKPRDLADAKVPVRQVGKHTYILAGAFVNTDHRMVKDLVLRRDRNQCSMVLPEIITRGEYPDEEGIPICGRNLIDYIPKVGSLRRRVVLGTAMGERNHIIPRGAALNAFIKAGWFGVIKEEEFYDPEHMLLVMSTMNIPELTALNGIDLERRKEELLIYCAQMMPFIDAAVNNVGNLVSACPDHHHRWYHPDEEIMTGISTFVSGIDTGELTVPLTTSPAYEGFKREMEKRILDNKEITNFRGDYGQKMALIREARMLVGLRNSPYWNPISTRVLLHLSRIRTTKLVHRMEIERQDALLRDLYDLAGEDGAGEEQLGEVRGAIGKHESLRRDIEDELHPTRYGVVGERLLKRMGIEVDDETASAVRSRAYWQGTAGI